MSLKQMCKKWQYSRIEASENKNKLLHALSEVLASPQLLSVQAVLEGTEKGLMVQPSLPFNILGFHLP